MRRRPLRKLRRLASFAASRKSTAEEEPVATTPPLRPSEPRANLTDDAIPPTAGTNAAGPLGISSSASAACEDRSLELEQLDDAQLLYVLQHADEQTVRLALAASSEGLWRRIVKRLPRRRAARLRRELFAIGPAKVSDLRRAQQDLLQLAAQRAA